VASAAVAEHLVESGAEQGVILHEAQHRSAVQETLEVGVRDRREHVHQARGELEEGSPQLAYLRCAAKAQETRVRLRSSFAVGVQDQELVTACGELPGDP
jgi:hypothetical protein